MVATDFEGPCVLGDTAAEVMAAVMIPHGAEYFNQLYHWYTGHRHRNKLPSSRAQEGTDIIFALPVLMHYGVTNQDIYTVAAESKPAPGAQNWIKFLNEQNSQIVAVTTAWQKFMTPLARALGIDYVVGTPLPIDYLRQVLQESGRYDQEMMITKQYIDDVFRLMDNPHDFSPLHARMERFFYQELGIDYTRPARAISLPALLGEMIQKTDVIGDYAKAQAASMLFRMYGDFQSIRVTMGDGLNDRWMLALGDYSIAVNGPDAARTAKIGIITPDLTALIPVFQVMMQLPNVDVRAVVEEARRQLGGGDSDTIIHTAKEINPELIDRHRRMRRVIRGSAAIIP